MPYEDNLPTEKHPCYFLTLNVVDRTDVFIRPVFKQIVVESLNYFSAKKGLNVYGWCLMTNHLHLIVQATENFGLSLLANDFKKFTTKLILENFDAESVVRRSWILKKFKGAGKRLWLIEKFRIWQTEIDPVHIDLENSDTINEYLELIHNNPVRNKIVSKAEDYLLSSARDYAGRKGLVNIQLYEEKDESDFILRHIAL